MSCFGSWDCHHSSVFYRIIPSDIFFSKFESLAVFAPNQDLYIKSWSVPTKISERVSPPKKRTLTWYYRHLRRTQRIYQPTIHKGRQRHLGQHRRQDTWDVLSYQVSHGQYLGQWINPIGSMYGIFTYICHKNQPIVGKYTIHGSYGNELLVELLFLQQSWKWKNYRGCSLNSSSRALASTSIITKIMRKRA